MANKFKYGIFYNKQNITATLSYCEIIEIANIYREEIINLLNLLI